MMHTHRTFTTWKIVKIPKKKKKKCQPQLLFSRSPTPSVLLFVSQGSNLTQPQNGFCVFHGSKVAIQIH